MHCVAAFDLGTTNFKIGLFGPTGQLLSLRRSPVASLLEPGTSRLPANRFWAKLREELHLTLADAALPPASIVALGYAAQANSFVLLDADQHELMPFWLWPELPVDSMLPALCELWNHPDFLATTGMGVAGPEFAANKLIWLRQHQPEVWARTAMCLNISGYFLSSLVGTPVTDGGTDGLLGLLNLPALDWWSVAATTVGLSRAQLPTVLQPGALAGRLTRGGAQRLGLSPGVPVMAGSMDHHLAGLGAGLDLFAPLSLSLGTVMALTRLTRTFTPSAGCCMGAATLPDTFYQLNFSAVGGCALEQFRRKHAPSEAFDALISRAANVPRGAPLAYSSTIPSHRAAAVRAILETSGKELHRLVHALHPGQPASIVATGGGARSDFWLQLLADMLGITLLRSDCEEPACRGAALLAAVGAGWFANLDAAQRAWVHIQTEFVPDPARQALYAGCLSRQS
jgi:xylulokinase